MRTSLQDVARRAGVSPSAASAALRPEPGGNVRLAEATRQRILEAAEELGYQSNPLARGLRGQSTRTIGVLWWLGSPPSREFMARRIARMLQRRGYSTYVADHFSSADHVVEALSNFALRGVDGVVIEAVASVASDPRVHEALRAFRASIVVQTTHRDAGLGADLIVQDRYTGIREAVDHLIATGRKRPLFFIARHASEGKAGVFFDQLQRHGFTAGADAAVHVDETQADNVSRLAYDALVQRHANRPDAPQFDAVLATSDELAVGAAAWLRERGLRVPDDVAVIGFNDSHVAPFLDPPLASVDRRDPQVVGEIESRLFQRLETPDAPRCVVSVPMRFVWRASAGGSPPV